MIIKIMYFGKRLAIDQWKKPGIPEIDTNMEIEF